jgi:hypothetical protein
VIDGDEWARSTATRLDHNVPYADFAMVFARTSGERGDSGWNTHFLVEPTCESRVRIELR